MTTSITQQLKVKNNSIIYINIQLAIWKNEDLLLYGKKINEFSDYYEINTEDGVTFVTHKDNIIDFSS